MTQTHTQTGTQSFRRMDESTAEQWAVIGTESFKNQGRVADRVLGMLESLADITDGFAVDPDQQVIASHACPRIILRAAAGLQFLRCR